MTQTLQKIRATCQDCGAQLLLECAPYENDDHREMVGRLVKLAVCTRCAVKRGVLPQGHKPSAQTDIYRLIPPDFRASDTTRFPAQQFALCKCWTPQGKGLYLCGPTRHYKSRIAYYLAMQSISRKLKCMTYDSRTFRGEVETRILTGKLYEWYKDVERADFFLIDDLGKFTGENKRVEEELFNVIKARVDQKRNVVITANDYPEALMSHFSPDIAVPLIARIKESCDTISFFGKEDTERQEVMFTPKADL